MNKTFQNFGEYLYYAYANLQMLHYALKADKPKYDRMCYMIRAKAFKAYKEGRWNIHDLFEFNIAKIKQNDYCWYCGKEMEASKLTKDHVFPYAQRNRPQCALLSHVYDTRTDINYKKTMQTKILRVVRHAG